MVGAALGIAVLVGVALVVLELRPQPQVGSPVRSPLPSGPTASVISPTDAVISPTLDPAPTPRVRVAGLEAGTSGSYLLDGTYATFWMVRNDSTDRQCHLRVGASIGGDVLTYVTVISVSLAPGSSISSGPAETVAFLHGTYELVIDADSDASPGTLTLCSDWSLQLDARGGGSDPIDSVVARNFEFDTKSLEAPAGAPFTISFQNEDPQDTLHDIDIRTLDGAVVEDLEPIPGGSAEAYLYGALEPGVYTFICEIHPIPSMTGTLTVR